MSSFSFPPPPPPPPKAGQTQSANAGVPSDASNRGRARGRGRGPSHHGRGDPRGQSSARPTQHSNYGQADSRHNAFGTNRVGGLPNMQMTQLQAFSHNLPAGAFVNPNFLPHQDAPSSRSGNGTNHTYARSNAQDSSGSQHGSPPRTIAGHKRKSEALRGPLQEKKPPPPTAPSVPSFGAPLLQPVAPLPTKPNASTGIQSKPKSTTNQLGLTPSTWDVRYSDSDSNDDDDEREVDEEALHAELGDKLTFEHNGVVMSLNSQADLAAWKSERQKKWPTRARMAERDIERWKLGEERKRLLAEADSLQFQRPKAKRKPMVGHEPAAQQHLNGSSQRDLGSESQDVQQPETVQQAEPVQQPETGLEKAKREVDEQTKRLEDLRKKVSDSEARNRQAIARSQPYGISITPNDAGTKHTDEEEAPSASGVQPEQMANEASGSDESSSHESSSEVSLDTSEEDSDDGPPEQITSKPTEVISQGAGMGVCRYFAASGYCRDGDACRFKHERTEGRLTTAERPIDQPPRPQRDNSAQSRRQPEQQTERQSLYQRLLEQQQEQEDRLALKVVKYLGQTGFFKEASGANDV